MAEAARALRALGDGAQLDAPTLALLRSVPEGDVEDGLALQLAVLELRRTDGEHLGGWKIGLTSRDARDSMGAGVRPFGYVLADRILPSGGTVGPSRGFRIEAEICLTIGAPLGGPDVTPDDARRAVTGVSAAFEICTPRLTGVSRAVRLGHGLNQWGVVAGEPHPPENDLSGITVTLYRDGEPAGTATASADVIDDPYLSLARLCRHLAGFGLTLEPGQKVITGSLLPSAPIEDAREWRADFGRYGEVRLGVA